MWPSAVRQVPVRQLLWVVICERLQDFSCRLALDDRVDHLHVLGRSYGIEPIIPTVLGADNLAIPFKVFDVIAGRAERHAKQLLEPPDVYAWGERHD